ncbi:hypothetical protein [Dactylosporangium sp. NPDC051541]|uniref:hypothetical protein n=1 Tax=Dactylosporangium sp. NPDC051541 TaxID=3363977 RepID=UPI00378D05FD
MPSQRREAAWNHHGYAAMSHGCHRSVAGPPGTTTVTAAWEPVLAEWLLAADHEKYAETGAEFLDT